MWKLSAAICTWKLTTCWLDDLVKTKEVLGFINMTILSRSGAVVSELSLEDDAFLRMIRVSVGASGAIN